MSGVVLHRSENTENVETKRHYCRRKSSRLCNGLTSVVSLTQQRQRWQKLTATAPARKLNNSRNRAMNRSAGRGRIACDDNDNDTTNNGRVTHMGHSPFSRAAKKYFCEKIRIGVTTHNTRDPEKFFSLF